MNRIAYAVLTRLPLIGVIASDLLDPCPCSQAREDFLESHTPEQMEILRRYEERHPTEFLTALEIKKILSGHKR